MKGKKILRLRMIYIISACSALIYTHSMDGFAEDSGPGVGPITKITLEAINPALVKKGKELFTTKCSACHKFEDRYVGPAMKGVTQRRSPEWIMNMILNPQEMLQKDAVAAQLLEEFLTPMTFQNVSQDDARAILEYFRNYDSGGDKNDKTEKKEKPKKRK